MFRKNNYWFFAKQNIDKIGPILINSSENLPKLVVVAIKIRKYEENYTKNAVKIKKRQPWTQGAAGSGDEGFHYLASHACMSGENTVTQNSIVHSLEWHLWRFPLLFGWVEGI